MTHHVYDPTPQASGPTVLMLHPAGVRPEEFAKLVGPVEGFECVYPQATSNLRWQHVGDSPDVAALLKIDAGFIAGMSSGSFMAARMLEAKTYRGGAMVAGGFIKALRPRPTPLMLVHGTLDAQVPYGGSQYALGALETAAAMRDWLIVPPAVTYTKIPNTKADGCRAEIHDWSGKVRLYTVKGGGHQYPCGPRTVWQPPELGRVCRDFDASLAMAEFFRSVP